jgi:hypothetical protein
MFTFRYPININEVGRRRLCCVSVYTPADASMNFSATSDNQEERKALSHEFFGEKSLEILLMFTEKKTATKTASREDR